MVRNPPIESKLAEPAIRQIEINFLAQPSLGSDADAIADDQHPNHQFRINRGSTHGAIEGRQIPMQRSLRSRKRSTLRSR